MPLRWRNYILVEIISYVKCMYNKFCTSFDLRSIMHYFGLRDYYKLGFYGMTYLFSDKYSVAFFIYPYRTLLLRFFCSYGCMCILKLSGVNVSVNPAQLKMEVGITPFWIKLKYPSLAQILKLGYTCTQYSETDYPSLCYLPPPLKRMFILQKLYNLFCFSCSILW